ncbi:NADP-dependent oxidoreductase [Sphingobium sp. CR2-8]|uniref:NADP-dependent oxidoreductase n=1 Tax=Sphingobium sp. CR2-8 TaxID=1306534 RepID=UPI002DBDC4D6|nr:NADP-dependent oxidoreductase [Sphingobium sp. CR2-8]MEC3910987.1 NADP-dependent oxidoreductase [Sphingobium sp. CR2-8]
MRQLVLADRPVGRPVAATDFTMVDVPMPTPGPGQMLLATRWLGFEPAQKGWMENFGGYVAPIELGDVMRGMGVAEVVASEGGKFPIGTMVVGMTGWTEALVSDGAGFDACHPDLPPQAMLGLLGIPGLTAWVGLHDIGRPVAGDTVLVSGAAGATGSVAGQLAKIAGCRVIGIAGGAEKCAWLVDEAGFDAAIDYKAGDISKQIKALAPDGVDVVYDNVGGEVLDAMLARLAIGARVVLCGGISRYEQGGKIAGPTNYFNLILRRATMGGFIILDHEAAWPRIRARLAALALAGRISWQTDVLDGLENAPAALARLFTGANRGKQVVRL